MSAPSVTRQLLVDAADDRVAVHGAAHVGAPPVPRSLEEAGLPAGQIEQLIVKSLYGGESTGLALADRLCLPFALLEPILERARAERLIEVRGGLIAGGATYRYALTDAGRDRARQYLDITQYVGPAPVPLASYVAVMRAQGGGHAALTREAMRDGFAHLVVPDAVLEQLGPAANAGKALFLYGPPGNGKTVIAEGLGRALGGAMWLPYAIDVDGQIITVFDPVTHERVAEDGPSSGLLDADTHDRRWVRVKRPVVVVGGELTLDMLDLTYNRIARTYEAPMQLKANGGVFLVDDFGRQRMRPEELLNRWIVPLESRVDYLTLHTGKKFEVPFHVLIVFATNLDPASLADEAFLRRIPYKIQIGDPSVEQYARIFRGACERRGLRYHQVMVAYLHRRHYRPYGRPLRACHPRDLLDQVHALCRYRGVEPAITRDLLDDACRSYFVDEPASREERRRLEIR